MIELRRHAKDFARVGGIRLAVFVHIGGKYLLGRKGLQLGRAAQGVRIMRPAAGSHVISIETTEKNPDELVDAPIEAENTPETDGE